LANQAGGLIGGNALQGLTNYGQGAASTEFQNAFNRFQTQRGNIYNTLAGIAGIGQTAQKQTSDLAQNVAGNIGQATIGIGNAYAGGQSWRCKCLCLALIPRRWQRIYVKQFAWLSRWCANKLWYCAAKLWQCTYNIKSRPNWWAGVNFYCKIRIKKWQIFQSPLLLKL
jgi:hypothetical protein